MATAIERPVSQSIPMMDSALQRPMSALARGVQITELSDGCMNPEPVILQESDILMEQYLSPTKLQLLTGCDRLENVTTMELKVDTSETTLNNFGHLLPNLTVLKLSGSLIPRIRDLGSSLQRLEVLWMSRCAVQELEGISAMMRLRELYLAYNEIADISPLSLLDELEILDLEGNNIDDIGQIQYLTLCTRLKHLTLDGNPVCVTPTADAAEEDYDYRRVVKRTLTDLSTLDDKSLSDVDSNTPQNVFDADWAFLEELQKDALLIESSQNENETVSSAGRPTTAALEAAAAYRPGSALRPSSGFRPITAHRRPASISGGRPSSAWTENSKKRPASSDAAEGVESASGLTCGSVICGNPSKALRARRKGGSCQDDSQDTDTFLNFHTLHQQSSSAGPHPRGGHVMTGQENRGVEDTGDEDAADEGGPIEDKDLSRLMQELQSWKLEHEKRLEKIRESKAPQVFTIDHNSDSLSDNHSDLNVSDDGDFLSDSTFQSDLAPATQKPSSPRKTSATNLSDISKKGIEPVSSEHIPHKQSVEKLATKPSKGQSLKSKRHKKSVDEDEQLLKEYLRLKELGRGHERQQEGDQASEHGRLRELRVPSGGPRPPSTRHVISHGTSSGFSVNFPEPPVSPGREPSHKDRHRKVKIGPTGLPGSSHSQQPQVRDCLSHTNQPSLGALVAPPVHRPVTPASSSSASVQHRIRRSLPEVLPLPSRPLSLPKS